VVTLKVLDAPDGSGAWKALIEEFGKTNSEIKIELVEGPASTDSREDIYARSFMTGQSIYDLVYMDIMWTPKFASAGWVIPLDDLFPPEEQAKFVPGNLAGYKYQGKSYGVPLTSGTGMLLYRRDILEANNLKPPETFTDLVEIATKLQNPPELYGFVFQGMQYEGLICAFLEILWGMGGDLIDENNNVLIDRPEAIEALTWLCDVVNRYKLTPPDITKYKEEEARRVFQEGHSIFMRNWPYAWNLAQADDSPIKGKVGIVPMVHKQGKKSVGCLGGWGFGISRFTPHKEAAWKFIKFVTSTEGQKIMSFKFAAPPSRHNLFNDPDILKANPHYPELYQIVLAGRPRPSHPAYARISDILQVYISSALVEQETPESALKKAAQEIRALLTK